MRFRCLHPAGGSNCRFRQQAEGIKETRNMKKLPKGWVAGLPGVLAAIGLAACSGGSPPPSQNSDSLAFDAQTVPLPKDIAFVYPRTPSFIARDGSDLVFTYNTTASEKRELGYIRIDGSGFRCLTCGTDWVGETPYPFGDGRRVLVQQASNQSPQQQAHVVLECRPSIADCRELSGKPVRGVAADNRLQSLQDRVVAVAPAGDAVMWTRIRLDGYLMLLGRFAEREDHYEVHDVRMINPPRDPALGEIGAPLAEAAWYEAKGLGNDGRTLAFTATLGESLNLDWFTMDLGSGRTQRQTTDPDWDEGGVPAPDLSLYKGATGRGRNEIAVYGNLPRPGLLDFVIVGPMFNYYLPRLLPVALPGRDRKANHGVHLFDAQGERPGYAGVDLTEADDAEGWIVSGHADYSPWSLDGRRIAVGQRRPDDIVNTRLRVFTFGNRAPVQVTPQPTLIPDWAPPIEDVPLRSRQEARVLQGPAGGTATLMMQGSLLEGVFSVSYQDYSSDGCSFLNGSQSMAGAVAINGVYRESLRISGCREGESEIEVLFADLLTTGSARSSYEGRSYEAEYGQR